MDKDKNLQKHQRACQVIDFCYDYKQKISAIPALAVGIVYKDKTVFAKGYGFADVNKRVPVTPDTCFRIASISKIFTSVSILQLVERKRIKLNEAVSIYLPWFKSNVDNSLEKITVRQLLTHTSGLTRDGDTSHWFDGNFPTLSHLKKYISQLKNPFKPGVRWKYSNLGYTILGVLIEKVSGMPYELYIQKNICQPLGLSLTSSLITKKIKSHLAVGCGRKIPGQERQTFPDIETNAMSPATGLSSSVNDLLKFIAVQFKGNNQVLSEKSKQEIRKIYWKNKKDGISQAIGFRTFKCKGRTIYYHSGGFQGYRTNIALDPERQIGVVTLTDVLGIDAIDFSKSTLNIINYFHSRPLEKDNPDLSKYEGIYRDIWSDEAVIVVGNNLIVFNPNLQSPLEHGAILKPVRTNMFLVTGSDEIESAGEMAEFIMDKNNHVERYHCGASYADILK